MNLGGKLGVVHVDTGRELRGGQQQLLLLARGLRARGHEQVIVCPEGSPLERRAKAESLQTFPLPGHDPGQLHGIVQLRQLLLASRFNILHAHDGRGQALAWLASLGTNVRRVASRRVTFLPAGRARHRFIYGRTCHAVIAISEFIRCLLIASGIPTEQITVIPDGVDFPEALPDASIRARIRRQWGFTEEEFVVGHLGAWTPEKGQDVAIEAALLLRETLPSLRLVLAGEGPMLDAQTVQQVMQKARDRIRLPGFVKDLPEFLSGLDLYMMPSRAEGLGSSALLAMAHGRAVIASRVGGLPEVVAEGISGWLVPPEDPKALAETILTAASDRVRLANFGARGRERARLFSDVIMLDRTEGLYRRLAA
jgi:glycosyltransferase involved in cell wall biosynthesis